MEDVEKETKNEEFLGLWDRVRQLGDELIEISVKCKSKGMALPTFCFEFYKEKISYKEFAALARGFIVLLRLLDKKESQEEIDSFKNKLVDAKFWEGRTDKIRELQSFCDFYELQYPQFIIAYMMGFITHKEFEILRDNFCTNYMN